MSWLPDQHVRDSELSADLLARPDRWMSQDTSREVEVAGTLKLMGEGVVQVATPDMTVRYGRQSPGNLGTRN